MNIWLKLVLVIFAITLIIKFTREFYISLYYCFKNKKKPLDELYGMIGFCGYYGSGKSLSMTNYINNCRYIAEKNGEDLKIYTNYHYIGQTAQLTCLDDIEKICEEKRKNKDDKSYTIFAIDELQNCLNSRQWNDTKKLESLLPIFTMTRKLRVIFLYTSPVLSMSDKNIRISSRYINICRKLNRYFYISWRVNPIDLEGTGKLKLPLFPSAHLLLTDKLKNSYDSYAFIETLQKQDYLKHNETETVNIFNNYVNANKKK